jgi:hypothetical protein
MNFDLWNVIDNAYIPSNAKSKRNKNEKIMFTMNTIVLGILRNSLDSHLSNKIASFDSAYKLWKYIEAHQKELHEEELQRTKEVDATSSELVNEDKATACLDPLGVSPSEVSSESETDDDISFEELANGFDKLRHAYNSLKLKHDNLQNDHDLLASEYDDVCKEKMTIMHAHEKLKIDYDSLSSKCQSISHEKIDAMVELEVAKNEIALLKNHVCSSSSNDSFIDEFKNLNDRMNTLNSTLNVCVHAHKNLENMCAKKQASSHKKTIYHAHMYAKVHKCTICGRKGHLARFCFDAQVRVQKPVSIGTNVPKVSHMHSMPHTHSHASIDHHEHAIVYDCTLCGRKGHLAKFCFDAKRIGFMKKNKTPRIFQNDNFSAYSRFDSHYAHPLHCTHCGRNGHSKDFCFDRIRAIDAPTWVRNPNGFGFGVKTPHMVDRAHNPSFLGPKRFWAPKTF